MNCPKCGNEMKKGVIEAKNAGSITQWSTVMLWYPDNYKGKIIKKDTVNLRVRAEGYYCNECMKVYAVFEEN